jgi:hypothetical protein
VRNILIFRLFRQGVGAQPVQSAHS